MKSTFGTPTGSNHLTNADVGQNGSNFPTLLSEKQGIYIMIPNDPNQFEASGHADMFFDGDCDGGCYFNATGGVSEIFFLGIKLNHKKMKNLIKFFITVLFYSNIQAQATKNQFEFDNQKIEYSSIPSKTISNSFYVIITKNKTGFPNLEKKVINCLKKKKNSGNIFLLVIPDNQLDKKENIILDFMNDILSKKKLIDKEMIVIEDDNYFTLYEEIRNKNKGKYKTCFLNKIHKTTIIKTEKNICKLIK